MGFPVLLHCASRTRFSLTGALRRTLSRCQKGQLVSGNPIEMVAVGCPYCGEPLEIAIDCTAGDQRYAEDCEVCCQPMELAITLDAEGFPAVRVAREDEA